MAYSIDLNCDVGEGVGNEEALMPYMSSCNIACGGHAGDEATMRHVVKLAKKHKVKIGAHPSFPDKENFGRQPMELSKNELVATIIKQVNAINSIVIDEQVNLHHIKPHGALYNMAANTDAIALSVIEAVKHFPGVKLFVPYGSVIADLAQEQHIDCVYEAFADRNYNENLTLVSRANEDAIILNSEAVYKHVFKIIDEEKVVTFNGVEVVLKADTFCIHGDHPNAIDLIKNLTRKLTENNVQIK